MEFRKWVPKISNLEILGRPIFQGRPIYSDYNHEHIFIFIPIEIRHNIILQYHGNYSEVKLIYMLELDILKYYSQKTWVS